MGGVVRLIGVALAMSLLRSSPVSRNTRMFLKVMSIFLAVVIVVVGIALMLFGGGDEEDFF